MLKKRIAKGTTATQSLSLQRLLALRVTTGVGIDVIDVEVMAGLSQRFLEVVEGHWWVVEASNLEPKRLGKFCIAKVERWCSHCWF